MKHEVTVFLAAAAMFVFVGSCATASQEQSDTAPQSTGSRAATPAAETSTETNALMEIVFEDDFEGAAIDAGKWKTVVAGGGFGNNELQFYTNRPENVRIEEGLLVLEARRERFRGHPFTSGMIQTEGLHSWTYGRIEVRAKLPKTQSTWPAIWMLPENMDDRGGWPTAGEIDIMEVVGHEPHISYGTLHYGEPHTFVATPYTLRQGDFGDDFHTFAIEWRPESIKWFIDGTQFKEETRWFSKNIKTTPHTEEPYPAPFNVPFFLKINVAVGGDWPGYPDETTILPQKMEIDWVRVYRFPEE